MPWDPKDAKRFTKHAGSHSAMWAKIANATLRRTGDDGQAIRVANAAVHQHAAKKKPAQ